MKGISSKSLKLFVKDQSVFDRARDKITHVFPINWESLYCSIMHERDLCCNESYISDQNTLMMSWGLELWDSYNAVVGHVSAEANNLVEVYAKYFKEKAELEKEYSKGLRKLTAKYEPKKQKENEELTEMSIFR